MLIPFWDWFFGTLFLIFLIIVREMGDYSPHHLW